MTINDKSQLEIDLDEIKPLAEWLAIEDGKTRLQWNEYVEQGGELRDYIKILGYTK